MSPGAVSLKHIDVGRVLGKGSFGKVHAVTLRANKKQLYAMKLLHKTHLIEKGMVEKAIEERKLLTQINHPLIVNLHYAFQSEINCCMIIDIMTGGDLRFHLDKDGPMPEARVKVCVVQ
jgi:serine/threonine kinase 32